jgi:hypothetical protein
MSGAISEERFIEVGATACTWRSTAKPTGP